jgi:hypothetical protein
MAISRSNGGFRYRLPPALHRWINDDGERHPVENTLALLTCALGVVSMTAVALTWWEVGAWSGLVGGLVAAYDELISKTSGERRLILVGFTLCVIGLAVSMANGAVF